MTRRPKLFSPGRVVESLDDLDHSARVGCWFFFGANPRPNHPSFIVSMQFNSLSNAVRAGKVRIAVRNEPERMPL